MAARLFSPQELTSLRALFPVLGTQVHGNPLIYLDNASTTQKPNVVIEAMAQYYRFQNANVHRTTHYLAHQAEAAVEEVREKVKKWINAKEAKEIVFTSGTTASLNLLANAYGYTHLKEGDEVVVSALEHHSNFLPWQRMAYEKGCKLKVIPLNEEGGVSLKDVTMCLSSKTKVVSLVHVSHVTGKELPIREIVKAAHKVGAVVMLDAAQSAPHIPLDVQALDVDFLVFSGHKIYGPTGVGVLYGKKRYLEEMHPHQMGGGMIRGLGPKREIIYEELPHRLEAGTLPLASIIGLGKSLAFLQNLCLSYVEKCREPHTHIAHTQALTQLAIDHLSKIEGLTMIGKGPRMGILSFVINGKHPLDIAMQLDLKGIAVRSGLQCAMYTMEELKLAHGVVRISVGLYNTPEEIEKAAQVITEIVHKS